MRLISSWDKFDVDSTTTFEHIGQTFTSKLDHFFWSIMLDNLVSDAGVLHLPDNNSDHSPIYCINDIPSNMMYPINRNPSPSHLGEELVLRRRISTKMI